ncbi:nitronate monooxygenase [Limisalsivibrio acetivorans]|uniref:nitronate monooxygenase n=1 Tax=Limisalsivibrio acetivorans TaxID=1304888 RepID=UPI0003B35C5A|nr:nitronate monooxygenase [Limisalsivibrio acetivorans]
MENPVIIQGGMGAAVSNWRLAKEVSLNGQLGVISGTAMDIILVRRLQEGDEGGHMRRALAAFPFQECAEKIIEKFYVEGGIESGKEYARIPMFSMEPPVELLELTVAANFVEVFLAKEGHEGVVGINLLEKIQLPNLASLYGAMLGGVDYVIMGAGIPREIPGILDKFSRGEDASMKINVEGAKVDDSFVMNFSPSALFGSDLPMLSRPKFLAIISSNVLATTMVKKATGKVDGLVIEYPSAGGHNAPPRGGMKLDESGEPIYGDKDRIDLEKIKGLSVPFWLAGGYEKYEKLKEAFSMGAVGVQVGTAFAFCRESGLDEKLRNAILRFGKFEVKTDPLASPTGFPFKVLRVLDTLSELSEYLARPRICNLGYLRTLFRKEDGTVGYRCPAEPVKAYIAKGGPVEETEGRKCLCNGLLANIGHASEYMNGYIEKPLVTAGSYFELIKEYISRGEYNFGASDVIETILGEREPGTVG